MPYLDELSDVAERLGNVNTITRLADGGLRGDNTDYYGFKVLVESVGVPLAGKVALVFGGDGGAGSTCMKVLEDLGVEAHVVSQQGEITYSDLAQWSHAALVVNCTPVGMFPNCPASVCSLDELTQLEAVVDIVYNPARTDLMMQAGARATSPIRRRPAHAGCAGVFKQWSDTPGETVSRDRIMEVTKALGFTEQHRPHWNARIWKDARWREPGANHRSRAYRPGPRF